MLEKFMNSQEIREQIKEAVVEELINDSNFREALKRLLK